jgi:hypothetical protein
MVVDVSVVVVYQGGSVVRSHECGWMRAVADSSAAFEVIVSLERRAPWDRL